MKRSAKNALIRLNEEIRTCEKCRLHKTRINAVPGEGPINAKLMICGQAPGKTEDKEGRPFVGRAGRVLDVALDSIELARKNIFITSSIKCFPPKNRPPRSDELQACKSNLFDQIKIIKPKIIVVLGNYAIKSILDANIPISQIHGEPLKKRKFIIFPTFHPSAAMRFPRIRSLFRKDFQKLKQLLNLL